MKSLFKWLAGISLITLTSLVIPSAFAQDLPKVRVATLKTGTVNWELKTIVDNGFDKANGFELEIQPYANNSAARIALAGGEADLIVADWIWAARQRAEGKDYVFIPYSKAVGGVVVPASSSAQNLKDLKGGKIGIAGGPLDKSWLILRAYAQKEYGFDLAKETEQVFAAPPLIFKAGLSGELNGAINFWHFLAKMKAAGMRELISVQQAAQTLGLNPQTPLLGYVFKERFLAQNPQLGAKLYQASRSAKELLLNNDEAWTAIRPIMRAKSPAQFVQLRDGFRAGIPEKGPVDLASADKMLSLMADLGGPALVGKATSLPEGLFLAVDGQSQ